MKAINIVTVTGADDKTDIDKLIKLLKKFCFAEAGILLSEKLAGTPRYPSMEWIEKFDDASRNNCIGSAGHICGQWTKDALHGEISPTFEKLLSMLCFDRFQFNTHGFKHHINYRFFTEVVTRLKIFGQSAILQCDGVNLSHQDTTLIKAAKDRGVLDDIEVLFDLSSGAGVLPSEWPKAFDSVNCGYAGGLSPENVKEQILKIPFLASPYALPWIDAETKLRSDVDNTFDLDRVEAFLQNAKEFVI